MRFDDLSDLAQSGFGGFATIETLQRSNCQEVPDEPGVYLVVWPHQGKPTFLEENPGGRFKGKNPTVSRDVLENHWVEEANVIYIGRTGNATGRATLCKRLRRLLRFGLGKAVGHWGGRFIWQISGSKELLLCWKTTSGHEAPLMESRLILDFINEYGKRPFANLRGEKRLRRNACLTVRRAMPPPTSAAG